MNPFTESTVARPVSQRHHDHCWPDAASDVDVLRKLPSDPSDFKVLPDGRTSTADKGVTSQRSGLARRSGNLAKSVLVVFGLGFSLMLSAVPSVVSGPAFAVGTVSFAGALMPRSAHAVDANRATLQELEGVRGIGPKTARTIVEERMRGGDYASLSDLSDRVKGIGPKKATALQAAGLIVASGAANAKTDLPSAAQTSRPPAKAIKR